MRRFALLITSCLLFSCDHNTPAENLTAHFDQMDVTHHWIAGAHVDWETGDPDGLPVSKTGHHTHCSAFVAAACERMGVYILRPPEHGQDFLADAQADWLESDKGWSKFANKVQAQQRANAGELVVAIYKNPDPKLPGHVALVRPSAGSETEIIQAGLTNYNRATLREGFKNHLGAFENNLIKFYAHGVDWNR
jgi:hypothetical protein